MLVNGDPHGSRKTIVALFAGLFVVTALARAGELPLNGQTFRLPDGFEVDVAALSPACSKAHCRRILTRWDACDVTDSLGLNDKVEKQLVEKPHRVLCLEDSDGDGKFDKSTVFADQMMFPEGTMWFNGSLYVRAPPSIWKLTDADGDGVAEKREEWFQGKTLTDCANDLHGPYLGPDGLIYWCKGAWESRLRAARGMAVCDARRAYFP